MHHRTVLLVLDSTQICMHYGVAAADSRPAAGKYWLTCRQSCCGRGLHGFSFACSWSIPRQSRRRTPSILWWRYGVRSIRLWRQYSFSSMPASRAYSSHRAPNACSLSCVRLIVAKMSTHMPIHTCNRGSAGRLCRFHDTFCIGVPGTHAINEFHMNVKHTLDTYVCAHLVLAYVCIACATQAPTICSVFARVSITLRPAPHLPQPRQLPAA